MSAVFVQARIGRDHPAQEGFVWCTAWTGTGAIGVTLRARPAARVLSGQEEPDWSPSQAFDEHVAVHETADLGPGMDSWTSIADVVVRDIETSGAARIRPQGAPLIMCVTDSETRTCSIASHDGTRVCFVARRCLVEGGAHGTAAAFAWAASFAHCLLVGGYGLVVLRRARLVIQNPRGEGGGVVLTPCERLTVQD